MNHDDETQVLLGSPAGSDAAGRELPLGAHLVTARRGYFHHGIYVGGNRVVHYAGFCAAWHRGPVEETTLDRFSGGREVSMRAHVHAKYSGEEAMRRARSRLGEENYRLLTNNCEHFCSWCVSGESRSEQVEACLHHPWTSIPLIASLLRAIFAALGPSLREA
ncbi:lecithin retinol acyltransferase family protein [Cupriavidus sp. 2MCAB6]|uniref:lecithin retinol acyltransferase family protein n=1 Tax=Cupriavidus sp. 2MCAB6 TaxID=3232981 RepID=UPI003F93A581